MKKILFLIHDLGQGGAEKVLVNLVNHLDKSKYCITVLALFGGGINEQFLNKDIQYRTVFKNSFKGNSHVFKLFSPRFLHRLFVKDYYDIEIAYLEGPSARVISGCDDKRTKTICWIHSEQKSIKDLACGFRNFKEARNSYNSFTEIIAVSKEVQTAFENVAEFKGHLRVLYNTIDSDTILLAAEENIDNYLFDKQTHLIAVGSLKPVKGVDRLLRVVKRLNDVNQSVNLIILGIGPQEAELKKIASCSGLRDHVTFLGYQTNPYKYVKHSDIFVCSSMSEGFSTAVTEALIVGTPVCTVKVPGMRELLGDNEYGVITENSEDALFEGLLGLITDPERLQYYAKCASERGKQFSCKATVSAVERLFDSL